MRCYKCLGRKQVYQIGGGYTLENPSGKKPIQCPICLGSGVIPDPEQRKELEKKIKKRAKKKK